MLRVASSLDVPALLNLEEALFPNSMTERMLQHELHRGMGWVIEEEGELLGYILMRSDDGLMDITRLGVAEHARRRGFARVLLEKALAEGGVFILTVKKDNTPALVLYRQFGFEIVAHLASAHAWIMKLTSVAK